MAPFSRYRSWKSSRIKRISDLHRPQRGEKRCADVNACAVMIAMTATGEIEDTLPEDGKKRAAEGGCPQQTGDAADA